MEASGYSIDLYCDYHDYSDEVSEHRHYQYPWRFSAETRGQCLKSARRCGWKFHRDGTHSCPLCNKFKK